MTGPGLCLLARSPGRLDSDKAHCSSGWRGLSNNTAIATTPTTRRGRALPMREDAEPGKQLPGEIRTTRRVAAALAPQIVVQHTPVVGTVPVRLP